MEVNTLKSTLSKSKQMSMEQSSEKGASAWLTSLPLAKYGFNMSKQSFRDALCLRFGWNPVRIASHCPCGHPFSVSHILFLFSPEVSVRSVTMTILYIYIYMCVCVCKYTVYVNNMVDVKAVLNSWL